MSNTAINGPDPIDLHVGLMVRMRRREQGLSRKVVGESLGVTWQQLAKYESAKNRVSASTLYRIAKTLEVEPGFFFEGIKA